MRLTTLEIREGFIAISYQVDPSIAPADETAERTWNTWGCELEDDVGTEYRDALHAAWPDGGELRYHPAPPGDATRLRVLVGRIESDEVAVEFESDM